MTGLKDEVPSYYVPKNLYKNDKKQLNNTNSIKDHVTIRSDIFENLQMNSGKCEFNKSDYETMIRPTHYGKTIDFLKSESLIEANEYMPIGQIHCSGYNYDRNSTESNDCRKMTNHIEVNSLQRAHQIVSSFFFTI